MAETDAFRYFTAPVAELDPALLEHAPGWERLTSAHSPDGAMRPWLQLWAGSAGACTQAHYDVADNVFVQLHGQKRFELYPPSAADALHVFPDAHPRARKAQLVVEAPDYARFPNAASLPAPVGFARF